MLVEILCSGSKGNCTLIKGAHTTLMIDCGAPTQKYFRQAMNETSTAIDSVDAVLITHNHSDHVSQLFQLRTRPVYSCCALDQIHKGKCPDPIMISDHHHIEAGEFIEIGEFTIYTMGLSHDACGTLGFVIEGNGEKLVYITDTGFVGHDHFPYIINADYYIMESNHDVQMLMESHRSMWLKQRILSATGHLCNQDAATILSLCVTPRTRQIVLAHLSEETNTPEKALEMIDEVFRKKNIPPEKFHITAACQRALTCFGQIHEDAI